MAVENIVFKISAQDELTRSLQASLVEIRKLNAQMDFLAKQEAIKGAAADTKDLTKATQASAAAATQSASAFSKMGTEVDRVDRVAADIAAGAKELKTVVSANFSGDFTKEFFAKIESGALTAEQAVNRLINTARKDLDTSQFAAFFRQLDAIGNVKAPQIGAAVRPMNPVAQAVAQAQNIQQVATLALNAEPAEATLNKFLKDVFDNLDKLQNFPLTLKGLEDAGIDVKELQAEIEKAIATTNIMPLQVPIDQTQVQKDLTQTVSTTKVPPIAPAKTTAQGAGNVVAGAGSLQAELDKTFQEGTEKFNKLSARLAELKKELAGTKDPVRQNFLRAQIFQINEDLDKAKVSIGKNFESFKDTFLAGGEQSIADNLSEALFGRSSAINSTIDFSIRLSKILPQLLPLLSNPFIIGAAAATAFVAVIGGMISDIIELSNELQKLEKQVGNLTGLQGEELKQSTAELSAIAETFNVNRDVLIGVANRISKDRGLTFGDSLDKLRIALKNGFTENDLQNIKEFDAVLRDFGLNIEQSFAFVRKATQQGLNPDTFLDSIQESSDRLRVFDADLRKALQPLGSTLVEETRKALDQRQITQAEATARFAQRTLDLLKSGQIDKSAAKNITEALFGAQAVKDGFEGILNTVTSFTDISKNIVTAIAPLGEAFAKELDKGFADGTLTLEQGVDKIKQRTSELLLAGQISNETAQSILANVADAQEKSTLKLSDAKKPIDELIEAQTRYNLIVRESGSGFTEAGIKQKLFFLEIRTAITELVARAIPYINQFIDFLREVFKSDLFDGFIMAAERLWKTLMTLGSLINEALIKPITELANLIIGVVGEAFGFFNKEIGTSITFIDILGKGIEFLTLQFRIGLNTIILFGKISANVFGTLTDVLLGTVKAVGALFSTTGSFTGQIGKLFDALGGRAKNVGAAFVDFGKTTAEDIKSLFDFSKEVDKINTKENPLDKFLGDDANRREGITAKATDTAKKEAEKAVVKIEADIKPFLDAIEKARDEIRKLIAEEPIKTVEFQARIDDLSFKKTEAGAIAAQRRVNTALKELRFENEVETLRLEIDERLKAQTEKLRLDREEERKRLNESVKDKGLLNEKLIELESKYQKELTKINETSAADRAETERMIRQKEIELALEIEREAAETRIKIAQIQEKSIRLAQLNRLKEVSETAQALFGDTQQFDKQREIQIRLALINKGEIQKGLEDTLTELRNDIREFEKTIMTSGVQEAIDGAKEGIINAKRLEAEAIAAYNEQILQSEIETSNKLMEIAKRKETARREEQDRMLSMLNMAVDETQGALDKLSGLAQGIIDNPNFSKLGDSIQSTFNNFGKGLITFVSEITKVVDTIQEGLKNRLALQREKIDLDLQFDTVAGRYEAVLNSIENAEADFAKAVENGDVKLQEALRGRIETLKQEGDALEDELSGIQKKTDANLAAQKKQLINFALDIGQQTSDAIFNAFKAASDARIAALDEAINRQIERVDELESAIEAGGERGEAIGARQLELERNRQDELERLKNEEIARQRELELVQLTVNAAIAVAKALASAPPPLNFVLAGLTAAAFVAQIIAIKSAATGLAAATGGKIEDGKFIRPGGKSELLRGKRHSDGGITIEAEDGEYIFSRQKSAAFKPLFDDILNGKLAPTDIISKADLPSFADAGKNIILVSPPSEGATSADIAGLGERIDRLEMTMRTLKGNEVNIDAEGVTTITNQVNWRKERIRNHKNK